MSWITRPGSAVSIAILLVLLQRCLRLRKSATSQVIGRCPLRANPVSLVDIARFNIAMPIPIVETDRPVLLVLASLFATPREIVRVGKSAFLVKPTGSARRAQRLVAAALATQLVTMWKAASAAQYALVRLRSTWGARLA